MARIAIIGGTGAGLLPVELNGASAPMTEWGPASAALTEWPCDDAHDVVFLPRHGLSGNIAPHAVNYRANLKLIQAFSPDWVVALNAVGGIAPDALPGALAIPDQLIDYTWGRAHTYYDGPESGLEFIDFTIPYSSNLRKHLISAAQDSDVQCLDSGVYGVTQGPRLETAAEIDRFERDGCGVVGMTAMPEAALARELDLEYASIALVVNRAAGRAASSIHAEIEQHLDQCIGQVVQLLQQLRQIL
jgi:5'-methylthioinosine phosphorylase